MTIIKPLTQLREIVSKALSGQTNLGKSFRTFFIETMHRKPPIKDVLFI